MPETWYTCQQPFVFAPVFIMERRMRIDHWVVFEEVHFDRDSVQYLLGDKNGPIEGRLPVRKPRMKPIHSIKTVDTRRWVKELSRQVQYIYGRQDPYLALQDRWTALLDRISDMDSFSAICSETLDFTIEALGVDMYPLKIHDSRDLVKNRPQNPTQWIEECGKALGATDYIQGASSMEEYFSPEYMRSMRVWAQDVKLEYKGVGGNIHDGTYSILDLLFTQTPDQIKTLFKADDKRRDLNAVRYVPVDGVGYRREEKA